MIDHPILFQPDMALAAWEGRKTQTRRILKQQIPPSSSVFMNEDEWEYNPHSYPRSESSDEPLHVPYKVGDRLWVQEMWATTYFPETATIYKGHEAFIDDTQPGIEWQFADEMPKWSSRMTLTVTDVRVQRLQDISEAEARAEGSNPHEFGTARNPSESYRLGFAEIIDKINGLDTWASNPWVAAYTFTVERRNILEIEA
jgi:hypothetical protein